MVRLPHGPFDASRLIHGFKRSHDSLIKLIHGFDRMSRVLRFRLISPDAVRFVAIVQRLRLAGGWTPEEARASVRA